MKLNTHRTFTVDEGPNSPRWESVPDLYLIPETIIDSMTLDSLHRRYAGKTLRFCVKEGENPALILRLEVI